MFCQQLVILLRTTQYGLTQYNKILFCMYSYASKAQILKFMGLIYRNALLSTNDLYSKKILMKMLYNTTNISIEHNYSFSKSSSISEK